MLELLRLAGIGLVTILTPLIGAMPSLGDGNIRPAEPWKIVSGIITPRTNTNNLQVPALGSSGNPCLKVDSSGNVATTTCGSGSGTVTSVDMSVPTGLTVGGNPVTTSGTLALTLTSGYNIPKTASTTDWQDFFTLPSTRITAGNDIDWAGNTLNVLDSWYNSATDVIAGFTGCSGTQYLGADGACHTDQTGSGNPDFTYNTDIGFGLTGSATGTKTHFTAGIHASGTSQFSNSSTTLMTAVTGWFTNLFIGADTLAEYISDTAGAFFTGNTETGITVTYQDADNTVDVVCDTASGSVFGCLASADWTTFNNKQGAISATYPLVLTGTTLSTPLASTTIKQTYGTNQSGELSFATTSDTNLGMDITNTGGAFTFTQRWIGTLADGRIASASTWNAKQDALTFTYPLINTASTITTAFGTTTANDFNALNTFNKASSTLLSAGTLYVGETATTTINSTGVISAPAGSQGAPAYSFSTDPDTGIYSSGADQLSFSALGSVRAHVAASGFVVNVNGSAASPSLSLANGNQGIFSAGSSIMGFSTNQIERMRILSSGEVGIGTTSPYAKLSVVGETVAAYFTATTSSTSTLPNASTTNFRLNGILDLWGTAASTFSTFVDAIIVSIKTKLTGIWDFSGATLRMPYSASPTVATGGDFGFDTTNKQLKIFDGDGITVLTGTTSPAYNIASTTADAMGKSMNIGTTTLLIKNDPEPFTLIGFYCKASTTGTVHVRFGDGTNWTEMASCTTGGFTRTSTNNTWTQWEDFNVQASSTATLNPVNRVTITTVINKTAQ